MKGMPPDEEPGGMVSMVRSVQDTGFSVICSRLLVPAAVNEEAEETTLGSRNRKMT